MKLSPKMFSLVCSGAKTMELRLYDEKRQLIRSGDTIVFQNTANSSHTAEVTVINVHWYDSFETLYKYIDKASMGYSSDEVAHHTDMEKYYEPYMQYETGVVAIEIQFCGTTSTEQVEYQKSSMRIPE